VPSEWLRQRKRDQFHRLAKKRGFRSRATFKLLQVAKQYGFVRRGDRVLDLGCAPGGWLQAAHQLVGGRGFILGVDLEAVAPLQFPNVVAIRGDITQEGLADYIKTVAPGIFDVVISDLAPDLSGVWEVDHARQIELARCALRVARILLRPSGNMLVKVFQGSDLKEFQLEMKSSFNVLRIVKPPASRPESAELYFLGLSYLGTVMQQSN
jgi:23S rRNA (uridine2552-2'-O)-methyltransferase